ncbi:TetR family transcriptional regulator [Sinobacterium caligoides]|uniref:TetR family transcriptional regulator n=1 Tax=Sinobacterium caligoides TaxID=933926 RepID=A0A3N2DY77_9GAMM|nr:TetR/AcrR family transcriptional regulator [Sinobacterium caligoides]ROS04737.1 TetR family transcriptional regulator [Sinobacterium caligoides]
MLNLRDKDTSMSSDKRQDILDTALQLFVEQGFHATSTASLAKAAGVANGTVFHHFGSKQGLISTLYLDIKSQLATDILPDEIPALPMNSQDIKLLSASIWNSAIDWAVDNPMKQQFFKTFSHSSVLDQTIRDEAMKKVMGFIEQLIVIGQQQGLLSQFPIELMLENCYGQYTHSAGYFIAHPQHAQSTEHRDAAFAMFWNALSVSTE